MKKFFAILAFLLVLTSGTLYAALTITPSAVDEWAEVAQNAVREGATTTISDSYGTVMHVEWGLSTETAHTGTKIETQISSNTSGDEDWVIYNSVIVGVGTANSEAPSGAEGAGSTVIEVASTTGLYDDDETRQIFIEDDTVANSELMYLVSHSANVSVTVQDGTTNAHDGSDTMYDIAGSFNVVIPIGFARVRVMYDNTYDSDGSTIHTKCRITETTSL